MDNQAPTLSVGKAALSADPVPNSVVLQKLIEQEVKIEKIYASVERTRKYFLATLILSILMIILPLIGLAFTLPSLLRSFQLPSATFLPNGLGL